MVAFVRLMSRISYEFFYCTLDTTLVDVPRFGEGHACTSCNDCASLLPDDVCAEQHCTEDCLQCFFLPKEHSCTLPTQR
jgi:hypothetical protein